MIVRKSLIVLSVLVLSFVLLLTACGGNDSSNQDVEVPSEQNDNPDESNNSENEEMEITLKVASTPTGPPYTFLNSETNKIEGIMVDIATELGKRMGMNIEIEGMQWSALIPSLQGGMVDLIAAGMYITDERKEVINFTEPVFGFGEGLIVTEDDMETKTLEDLKDKIVGVQIGTTYKDMLEELNIAKELKVYNSIGDMLLELNNKRLDAVVADAPVLIYLKEQNPNFKIRVVDEYEPSLVGNVGIGVAKENEELLNEINKVIEEIKEDGTLQSIYDKWQVRWRF